MNNLKFNNSKFSNKLDETFVIKLYEFKNKLINVNPKLNFYLSFGNLTIQIFYKIEQKKHIFCYIDKFNGNITKTNYKDKENKILSNINDTSSFIFDINF